jgi:hypothetical protein
MRTEWWMALCTAKALYCAVGDRNVDLLGGLATILGR